MVTKREWFEKKLEKMDSDLKGRNKRISILFSSATILLVGIIVCTISNSKPVDTSLSSLPVWDWELSKQTIPLIPPMNWINIVLFVAFLSLLSLYMLAGLECIGRERFLRYRCRLSDRIIREIEQEEMIIERRR